MGNFNPRLVNFGPQFVKFNPTFKKLQTNKISQILYNIL